MVIVPYLKMSIISFLLQNDIPHVLLVNLFKQTHPSDSFVVTSVTFYGAYISHLVCIRMA
jgi:hypothetical protein